MNNPMNAGYTKRLNTLCSLLSPCESFADVGCDHGYCSEYMLKNGLCNRVIFSDISKGSLAKAEKLLAPYIAEGKATPVLGNGFYGVPSDTELVLIAGMGGSEIISILSDKKHGFMPKRFVFQPMHDAERLRRYLLENGAEIQRDFTFEDGKYYEVIVGGQAQTRMQYSQAEYEFGRENLLQRPQAFLDRIQKLIANTKQYLSKPLQEDSRKELEERKKRLEGVLNGEIK